MSEHDIGDRIVAILLIRRSCRRDEVVKRIAAHSSGTSDYLVHRRATAPAKLGSFENEASTAMRRLCLVVEVAADLHLPTDFIGVTRVLWEGSWGRPISRRG